MGSTSPGSIARNKAKTYITSPPSPATFHHGSNCKGKGKGKAIPLQAKTGPEGSRSLRLQDFMTIGTKGDKVVSPTHWPPLPPGNIPGTHFC